MPLKELSPQQRQDARNKALEARTARADIKKAFRAGEKTLAEVFVEADANEFIGRLRIVDLLSQIKGVGPVRALKMLDEVGISHGRRLKGVGKLQRNYLIEEVDKYNIRNNRV